MGAEGGIASRLRRIANESAELPWLRLLAKPLYARRFRRAHDNHEDVHYYGIYRTHAEARRHSPATLPASFDIPAAAQLYRQFHDKLRVSDYPMLYWLSRVLGGGERRIFELGGHIGVSYYAFKRYLAYPSGLRWTVHDMPGINASGREWAVEHDPERYLTFSDVPTDADGCDVLVTSGTLQYLDYTLAELLQGLARPPAHILVNRVPMHPRESFFTLQNFGMAICPYRVTAVPDFINSLTSLGYELGDHWKSYERHLRIPFEHAHSVDCYHGFYFRRSGNFRENTISA